MEVILQSKTTTSRANGTQVVTPEASGIGIDALDQVTVVTDVEDEHTFRKGTFKENGSFDAPEGTAYNKVVVEVEGGNLEELTVTENGVYEPDEESEFDGYSKVTVDVQPDLEDITFVSNGTYTSDVDGYKTVTVNVPSDINNQEKTATENGTVLADEGYSGLSKVIVNVQPTEEQIAEFKAEQLAEDKAAVEAVSPITENGTVSVIGASIVVNVPDSEEGLAAAKAEGKAEQLVDDKAAIAAASPITENGTKTILDTEITVNVPSDPEELAEAKAEGVTEGKAAQLVDDKAAVAAASPITANGTKTILGESITVNVPDSEEGLAAAKAEGKAEQLVDDKAKVAAVEEITTNGTKAIGDLGSVMVNVSGGGQYWPNYSMSIGSTIWPDAKVAPINYDGTPWNQTISLSGTYDKNFMLDAQAATLSGSSIKINANEVDINCGYYNCSSAVITAEKVSLKYTNLNSSYATITANDIDLTCNQNAHTIKWPDNRPIRVTLDYISALNNSSSVLMRPKPNSGTDAVINLTGNCILPLTAPDGTLTEDNDITININSDYCRIGNSSGCGANIVGNGCKAFYKSGDTSTIGMARYSGNTQYYGRSIRSIKGIDWSEYTNSSITLYADKVYDLTGLKSRIYLTSTGSTKEYSLIDTDSFAAIADTVANSTTSFIINTIQDQYLPEDFVAKMTEKGWTVQVI